MAHSLLETDPWHLKTVGEQLLGRRNERFSKAIGGHPVSVRFKLARSFPAQFCIDRGIHLLANRRDEPTIAVGQSIDQPAPSRTARSPGGFNQLVKLANQATDRHFQTARMTRASPVLE